MGTGFYRWDLWFLETGDEVTMFRLESPVTGRPDDRHHDGVRIVSSTGERSLGAWGPTGVALSPGPAGSWDDLALWSGCAIAHDETAYLFYTGRSRNRFWRQRIGLAKSPLDDLRRWKKLPRPVAEPSRAWYEQPETPNELDTAPAWRDPWVSGRTGEWEMLVTARDSRIDGPFNGCVGRLTSADLLRWDPDEPCFSPGLFDEIELPQTIRRRDTVYLLFSTHARSLSPEWHERFGSARARGGLHCWYSDGDGADWRPANGDGIVLGLEAPRVYGVRLLSGTVGTHRALGWLDEDSQGDFSGELTDPLEIRLEGDRVTLLPA